MLEGEQAQWKVLGSAWLIQYKIVQTGALRLTELPKSLGIKQRRSLQTDRYEGNKVQK